MLDDNDKTELISQNPSIMQNKVNFNMFKIIHKLTEVGFFDFMFQNKEDKEAFLEKLKAYKVKLEKDPENTVDIYEFNTKNIFIFKKKRLSF